MATSSQKFIARNRAPRVQIEYDVELYGAEKKVQLPFVMGVMSDLSGKPSEPLAPVADRKFLEVDVDNFDSRMKAMKPRVAFQVPNTLTGEGNIAVDITFDNMEDFSPAAVAAKVDGLKQMLEARQQLANLITYMDGKVGAKNSSPRSSRTKPCSSRWPPSRPRPARADHAAAARKHPFRSRNVTRKLDRHGRPELPIRIRPPGRDFPRQ